MFRNLKHLVKAAGNIVAISYIETAYRLTQASDATESVTSKLEAKSEALRKSYEQNLVVRKAGIKKPTVVTEAETPENAVIISN